MRHWPSCLFVLFVIALSWAALAQGNGDHEHYNGNGNHYGWDKDRQRGSALPASPQAHSAEDAGHSVVAPYYLSDYYVGNGPITLSGNALRRSLGADAGRHPR